jgi:hypothetical protein
MDSTNFEWWESFTAAQQAADERADTIAGELDGDVYESFMKDLNDDVGGGDLEDCPGQINAVCDRYEK